MKKFLTLLLFVGAVCFTHAQTNVSGTISTNTTWNVAGSPYIVTGNVAVNSGFTLTIESGVTVKFNSNTRLTAYGTVSATNATFTSNQTTKAKGDWSGLYAGTGSTAGQISLTNCTVEYGTNMVVYVGSINLTNTTVSNFSGKSLILSYKTSSSAISGSIITSSNSYPISFDGPGTLTLSGTNDFTGNKYNAAEISFGSLTTTFNLPTLPVPWVFPSFTVAAAGELTIASNNILKFNNYTLLKVDGKLVAQGTAPSEYIHFTSIKDDNWGGDTNADGSATSGSSQSWYGIEFTNGTTASTMSRCKLRYAGYYLNGGVRTTNSSPVISDCEFQSNYFGIYIAGTSAPQISNTIIGSSDMTPIAMSFDSNPVFTNNTLSFSDNQYDAIGLIGGTLAGNGHIIKRNFTAINNITYFMLGEITVPVGKTLTIDPGIVIKSVNRSYNFVIEGKLIAKGTVASPIVFTSAKDDNHGNPGDTNKDGTISTPTVNDFGGIFFTATSDPTSLMRNCVIKYANASGKNYYGRTMGDAGVITVNSSPTIDSCEFKDMTYGIKCFEASNPKIAYNKMVNISKTPFNISGSANPIFANNEYINVGWNALGLIGGKVTQNGVIKKRDVAGFTNITYVLTEELTIENGTYVSVEPEVVIKIDKYVGITVKGGFKAVGTNTKKIYFTSIDNDNIGNPFDTNGNGNTTSPQAGDWYRIYFDETSDDGYCKIEYCEISYAGYYWAVYSGIETYNSSPVIKNTLINNIYNYGVRIMGNSAPILENVTIQNCRLSPVGMSLTSDPTFINMTFTSNADKMLAILEGDLSSDAFLKIRSVAGFDNIAYKVDNLTIKSNAKLTIQPGVVIKSQSGRIVVEGALVANGDATHRTIFTSVKDDSASGDSNDDGNTSVPNPGDWQGIEHKSSGMASQNLLNFVQVKYSNYSVRYNSSTGTLSNSIITLSNNNGVQVLGASDPTISNNSFTNIEYAAAHISMFSNPTFSNNTIANVGIYGLSVEPETYSKSATVPKRNFAGNNNVTYYLNGTYNIIEGTTITIPAGIVFKSLYRVSGWYPQHANINVKGKLIVQGTQAEPVVFTGFYDDAYGAPSDLGNDGPNDFADRLNTWITFENVSNDTSLINYAVFKYAAQAINLKSASPTITNTWFYKTDYGITHNGVSTPKINNNVFEDLRYTPLKISLVAYPAETNNNVIKGSTWKGIEVNDETLTQDVVLPKRSFGGIVNIPYVFDNYTIGTSAGIDIEQGVVLKFKANRRMTVQRTLKALGGLTPDKTIKFTSVTDDFYGGDTNSDSIATAPDRDKWYGIHFVNESLDDQCKLENVVIANTVSYGAVTVTNASPTISKAVINKAYDGLQVNGSSNPKINETDFIDITRFAVNNISKSFVINAENNWWGDNSGPKHSSNVGGKGYEVTDAVDFVPWRSTGVNKPITGDVSLNGKIQAYDASLVLQHVVSLITLTAQQQNVAEVSGDGNINAFDASLILQNIVDNSQTFPVETKSALMTVPSLYVEDRMVNSGEEFVIPVYLNDANNLSVQGFINYDATVLEFRGMRQAGMSSNSLMVHNDLGGKVAFAVASGEKLGGSGKIAELVFSVIPTSTCLNGCQVTFTDVLFDNQPANEQVSALVTIAGVSTGLAQNFDIEPISAYPNPFRDNLTVSFRTVEMQQITLRLVDVTGKQVALLAHGMYQPGSYTVNWNGFEGKAPASGVYFLELSRGNELITKRLIAQ